MRPGSHAPGPALTRERHHEECPWIVVSPERGVCLCRHCEETSLLPPRTEPQFAAAAIEGFVLKHHGCRGPLEAVAIRRGRIVAEPVRPHLM